MAEKVQHLMIYMLEITCTSVLLERGVQVNVQDKNSGNRRGQRGMSKSIPPSLDKYLNSFLSLFKSTKPFPDLELSFPICRRNSAAEMSWGSHEFEVLSSHIITVIIHGSSIIGNHMY